MGPGAKIAQRQHHAGPGGTGPDDERSDAVPVFDDLQLQHAGVFAQRFAAEIDGFSLAPGLDDGGVGLDFGLLLGETGPRGLLFLDHLRLDGVFERLGEVDVLQHDILNHDYVAHFQPRAFERPAFHFLPLLDDHLGGAQRGDFVDGLCHPRFDQRFEGDTFVVAKKGDDRGWRHAVKDAHIDFHLL